MFLSHYLLSLAISSFRLAEQNGNHQVGLCYMPQCRREKEKEELYFPSFTFPQSRTPKNKFLLMWQCLAMGSNYKEFFVQN